MREGGRNERVGRNLLECRNMKFCTYHVCMPKCVLVKCLVMGESERRAKSGREGEERGGGVRGK